MRVEAAFVPKKNPGTTIEPEDSTASGGRGPCQGRALRIAFAFFGGCMLGPIFVREWLTLPRRARHYVSRTLYLGLLWVLALTAWQATVGWEQAATLGDTARFGLLLFHVLPYVQLVLLMFFAALSAASTIAQEKDRRTFILLLVTD